MLKRVINVISHSHLSRRCYASASNVVKVVEVGPRDGLQNEPRTIPAQIKVDLINQLGRAGLKVIEVGSFVSPKWVPQMADTRDVLTQMEVLPGVHYPVLVPNKKGLEALTNLMKETNSRPTDEVSIFTAASDAFNKANTNCTTLESLQRLEDVTRVALDNGFRVRGYVSTVISCPFSGKTDYTVVRDVSRALLDMGCYEVSLGDTVGTGTPATVSEMLNAVAQKVPMYKVAGHFHDTFGMGVANVFSALDAGVRTIDSSVGGLGGCPFAPGATGNVATEDVIHALRDSGYTVDGDLPKLVDIGFWISQELGRTNCSRAGTAYRAKAFQKEKSSSK